LKPLNRVRTERKPAKMSHAEKIETEIDHILATEEELTPSSGFVASVMERVQEEAATPPIPFPWKLAIPGILLAAGVFSWVTIELLRLGVAEHGLPTLRAFTLSSLHLTTSAVQSLEEAGWVALALGASLLSCLLSRRLAGRGGLL
jgi:hypothetical protein